MCPSRSLPPCAPWSLDLPEVIVDGQSVHADGHSLGRDDSELLPVRAVFVELVDHLQTDGPRSRACEFDDLLSVRWVRVNGTELAPAVTEEDDEVVGFTLLQLLHRRDNSCLWTWQCMSETTFSPWGKVRWQLYMCSFYMFNTWQTHSTHLKNDIFLDLIDFSSQAAVSDGIDDDWLVGFGAWLFEEFGTY